MSGPKTIGKDFNYFTRINVANQNFNSDADVIIPLKGPISFSLINEGNDTVDYSFNGITKHGDLFPNTPSASLGFSNRSVSNIWFKSPSGNLSTVRIEAFAGGSVSAISGLITTAGGVVSANTEILGPLGTKTKSQSIAVTLSIDEPPIDVNLNNLNGVALDTTLSTTNSILTSLNSKFNTLGQKNMAGSIPVTIASDQSTIIITGSVSVDNFPSNIIANIGTTNGLALDTTLSKLTVAQSAVLGTNTQTLIGGSVTTSSPSYINGNINPLSLTTTGALRVDGSGITQPISATSLPLPTNASTSVIQTDGTQKAQLAGIAKGTTSAASTTVSSFDANHNVVDFRLFGYTSIDKQATLATTGKVLKSGSAVFLYILFKNTIGAGNSIWLQVHDLAAGPPVVGTQALGYSTAAATPNNGIGQLGILGSSFGFTCSTGLLIIASSTQETYTAVANSNISYTAIYI